MHSICFLFQLGMVHGLHSFAHSVTTSFIGILFPKPSLTKLVNNISISHLTRCLPEIPNLLPNAPHGMFLHPVFWLQPLSMCITCFKMQLMQKLALHFSLTSCEQRLMQSWSLLVKDICQMLLVFQCMRRLE